MRPLYPNISRKSFVLILFFFGMFSVISHYYNGWDFKNYHWYNAYSFLHNRIDFDINPGQMQTYFNPLLDTFNYIIIKLLHFTPIYQFFFGILSALSTYFLIKITGRLLYAQPAGIYNFALFCAVLIGISDPIFISQIGVGFIDEETAILVLMALYYALRVLDAENLKEACKYSAITGICLGLAMGFKFTTSPYILGLALAYCFYTKPSFSRFYIILICIITFILSFFLVEGFWMIHLYHLYQNPFYPLFNNIFHSPYAAFGSFGQKRTYLFPQNTFQWWFYPFYWLKTNTLISESHMRDWRFVSVILLGLAALLKYFFRDKSQQKNSENKIWAFLIIFLIISYVAWLYSFSIYRYMVPTALITGTFIICALLYLFKDLNLRNLKRILIIVTILLLGTSVYPIWGKMPSFHVKTPNLPLNAYVILAGDTPPQGYLVSFFPKDIRFISPQNNFMDIHNQNALQLEANNMINEYQGPLYIIEYPGSNFSQLLAFYHFNELKETCQPISSSVEKFTFEVCQLKRINNYSS